MTGLLPEPKAADGRNGKTPKSGLDKRTGRVRPGQELVAAGYAGYAGTVLIVRQKREELLSWFSGMYLDKITEEEPGIWKGLPRQRTAIGVTEGEPAGEGGILTALWNLSGAHKVGIEFSLDLIPVKQCTVEICERYGLNPYRLYSEGCRLFAADHGSELVRCLEEGGSCAAVIGKVTCESSRIIRHEESIGYLERPAADEIHKLFRR